MLAVMALKYIKVMKGGFSLPTDLASTLLMKVSNTGTEMFNRQVMDQYSVTDALERRYEMKDPKLLLADPQYDAYGPVGCCAFLQEKYAILFTQKRWTALAESPSANLTHGLRCFECDSPDHLQNECPRLGRSSTGRGTNSGRGGNGGRGNRY